MLPCPLCDKNTTTKGNSRKKGFISVYSPRGIEIIMAGKRRKHGGSRKLTGSREKEPEVGPDYELQSQFLSNMLPSARLHLFKVLQPPQIAPPAETNCSNM